MQTSTPLYPPPPSPFVYPPPSVFHVHYQLPTQPEQPVTTDRNKNLSSSPPPRRYRANYTPSQLRALEDVFAEKHYVNKEERYRLSLEVGVTDKQVKMWFQNRRTKMKKERSLMH
ncbi:Homeobox protein SAX-1 (Fragment) [Geodia barretti]|uniref:Homeobox protein SAX-1 n=1 Tax=Geodia barretti TaxID=519541 RepID=A0AA35RA62_GEOBA